MKVTDEDVQVAHEAFNEAANEWNDNYFSDKGVTLCDHAMRAALESFALSHAAGQEETTNPAEIGRKSVGGEEVAIYQVSIEGMCEWMDVSRAEYEHHVSRGTVPTRIAYLTHAQPPASAEVGRDAARYRWLRDNNGVDNGIGVQVFIDDESYAPGFLDAQIDAAMAASSGRNGGESLSPIAGVTHGTGEGLGDE